MAALDSKRGLANDHGIPWYGRLPTDVQYYHDKIRGQTVIMGYGMYIELSKPLVAAANYVASTEDIQLRSGFILVEDARQFLQGAKEDVWVFGGAKLFASTLDLADELYLTQLHQDFHCTKFFPDFEEQFHLVSQNEPQIENDITFHFEVWARNQ